jgi:hypothetical protein
MDLFCYNIVQPITQRTYKMGLSLKTHRVEKMTNTNTVPLAKKIQVIIDISVSKNKNWRAKETYKRACSY